MKTVTVKLTPDLDLRLEKLAKQLGENKSVVLRLALQELLRQPHILHKTSAFELLSDWCGVIDNLPKDLSSSAKHFEGYGE